jgi:hypothetical protein
MYGAALNLLFDKITAGETSNYIISKIIEVSEQCGDIKTAKKFKNLLYYSLFRKKRVHSPFRKATDITSRNFAVNAYFPSQTIYLEYKNQIAIQKPILEYAILEALLDKRYNLDDIILFVEKIQILGYSKIPQALQEALIIKGLNPDTQVYGYRISKETIEESSAFSKNLPMDRLSAFHGKNYFFYFNYEKIKEQ